MQEMWTDTSLLDGGRKGSELNGKCLDYVCSIWNICGDYMVDIWERKDLKMNREIKFNIYDKTTDTYYKSDEYDFNIDFGCKTIAITKKDLYSDASVLDYEKEIECALLEYTGSKDDNNIEIYEGDIIQEGDWDDLYLVVFEDCKFIAQKIGKHNGDIFTKRDKDLDGVWYPAVVGNKYENPDLLKE